jgi:hypothetical protein
MDDIPPSVSPYRETTGGAPMRTGLGEERDCSTDQCQSASYEMTSVRSVL